MPRFLSNADLSAEIKIILAGGDVRCAVAFWGMGANAQFTPPSGTRPRIICDVTLGGTSPIALSELGAPSNENLRHIPGFHAKVYLSDKGAIVGSPNASRNGIGFDGPPNLIEAGILLDPNEQAFAETARWFETMWGMSKTVGKSALTLASERYKPDRTSNGRSPRPGSLLDLIVLDPDRFSELSIVLTSEESNANQRRRARSAVASAHSDQAEDVASMPDSGMFIGWERRDLSRWRRTFIELWIPMGRLDVYGRKASFFHDGTGTVMSCRYWPAVRSVVKGDLPSPSAISDVDCQEVLLLRDKFGNKLFSARQLADEVGKLRN